MAGRLFTARGTVLAELRSRVIWIGIHQEVCFRLPPSARGCANSDQFHCRFDSFKWGLSHSSGLKKQRHLLNKKSVSPSIGCGCRQRYFCWNKQALPSCCRLSVPGGVVPVGLQNHSRPAGEDVPSTELSLSCSCREDRRFFGKLSSPRQAGFALLGELLETGQRGDARALRGTLFTPLVMQMGLQLRWSLSNVTVRITNFRRDKRANWKCPYGVCCLTLKHSP